LVVTAQNFQIYMSSERMASKLKNLTLSASQAEKQRLESISHTMLHAS